MERRKIQLITGMTYSISLPKYWVLHNGLKEKSELVILEKDKKTLILSVSEKKEHKKDDIEIEIDEYLHNIDQVLLAIYYQGIENITLHSKKGLANEIRPIIRKTLTQMSGTEITYEDKNVMKIKVLLDMSKIDIYQLFYRIILVLESSMAVLSGIVNLEEIRMNENEIDRLYHLITKIITISMKDEATLLSSKIKNVTFIPSLFLISKKLENIGDSINHLSSYIHKNRIDISSKKQILGMLSKELMKSAEFLIKKQNMMFLITDDSAMKNLRELIDSQKDQSVKVFLREVKRYLIDIQQEMMHLSFYSKLYKGED